MPSMRILLVTATYPPSVNGVAYQVQLLFQTLASLGHKVMVLAPNNPRQKKMEKNIIRYFSVDQPFFNNYPIGIPLISPDKIKKFKPQAIHTHHPFIWGAIASFLAQKQSIPLFLTHHTRYQEYLNCHFPAGFKLTQKILNHHLKKFSQKTNQIICPSIFTKTQLAKIGISNTTVIANGIDLKNFKPAKTKPKNLNLIFVGRLEKEKSPQKLITLAKYLRKLTKLFKLTITGTGKLEDYLQKQAKKQKLANNIFFTGLVPRERLSHLLNQHQFFISFSKTEVMPLTHLEAQACGLVPVIPQNAGLKGFLNSQNSLIVPKSHQKTARLIINTFQDKNRLQKYSQNSLENAQKYSIQNTCKKTLKLYQKYI